MIRATSPLCSPAGSDRRKTKEGTRLRPLFKRQIRLELFLLGLRLGRRRFFGRGLGRFFRAFFGSSLGFSLLGLFLSGFFLRRGFLHQLLVVGIILYAERSPFG